MSARLLRPGYALVFAKPDGNLLVLTNRDGKILREVIEL